MTYVEGVSAQETVIVERKSTSASSVVVAVLLLLTMFAGGYFRFVSLNWDDYVRFHPDERFLSSVASSLGRPLSAMFLNNATADENQAQYNRCLERYPETQGAGGYFDAECSLLNPHNVGHGLYVYGTLPLFAARWAGEAAVELTGDPVWTSYDGVHLIWRLLSAISDMLVVLVVYAIGTQLHGKWVGLIAAMLYAFAVFPIQQAHFGTTDAMTGLFVALSIWFAVRVQAKGDLADYVLFGAAFGAALASRVNVAPLVGVILLAAILRVIPALDLRLPSNERRSIWIANAVGLVLAGILTLLVFRVMNPYAFMGPGFFGIRPNPAWLEDIAEAQRLVSGNAEMPPNWQWVGRAPFLFPLQNMVLWGMGIGLGLAGWLSLVWSLIRVVRGRAGAAKNLLLVAWVVAYFGLLGGGWVTTMRYFLPLYPVLAVLAAWGVVELVRQSRGHAVRGLLARGVLVAVVGFTALWAAMFTNIYRHQSTPVQAGIWVWEQAPGDFAMELEGAPEGTPLVNIALINGFGAADMDLLAQATRIEDGERAFYDFTVSAEGTITTVQAPHLGDPNDDPDDESIRVMIYGQGMSQLLAEGGLTANFTRENNVLGDSYTIELNDPLPVQPGRTYTFVAEVVDGGPIVTGGSIFSWEGDWDEPTPSKTCIFPDGVTLADDPMPGLWSAYTCNGHDPWSSLINGYKQQIIYDDVEVKRDRLQTTLDNSDYIIIGTNRRYDSQNRIPTKWPMTNDYYDALFSGELGFEIEELFQETFELGPLMVSDQYLPQYDAPAWLNEFEAEEAFHVYDHPVVYVFRKTDAYSSENTARILGSVPLTNVGQVNFNCPEAADLPVVNYYCDPNIAGVYQLRATGKDVSLSADQSPLALQFGDDMEQVQTDGGTWSNRFDSNSPINTQPVLTVAIWWIAVMLFGWAVWPLLYVALPGLADRGYGLAKFFGMFVVGWAAWLVASARVPAWSQIGVLVALFAVGIVGVVIAWRTRAKIVPYIQDYWPRLLGIEAITLVLFLAFLAVRLSNPDLWHPAYGGEKPMDFAYFNGVLRSTVFPAIDPWYAGGYINYYYFGYVIVGAPVLLLGIVPSIAYNLIIPTLFALTGISAFSVAFNVVSGWRSRRLAEEAGETKPKTLGNPWLAGIAALLLTVVLGNLDTSRIILAELGELGGYQQPVTLEQFLVDEYSEANDGAEPDSSALTDIFQRAQSGSMVDRVRYEWSNFHESVDSVFRGIGRAMNGGFAVSPDRWFWGPTRVLAEPPVNSGGAIAELPYFTFLYGDLHAHMIAMPLQLFVMAFLLNEIVLAGRARRTLFVAGLAIFIGGLGAGMLRATNTWDWATFMVLGVAGLGFSWWLRWSGASRDTRLADIAHVALIVLSLGSLVGGILVYLVTRQFSGLATIGVGAGVAFFVLFLFWDAVASRLTRWSLVDFVLRVGGFVLVSMAVAVPFTTWYAATYNSILPWEGNRTPVWAYLDIHGLFLFLIFSLLVWDTSRWFRSTYVRSLRGRGKLLGGLFALILLLLGASVWLAMQSYQVTLIALPLLVWITVLFFRGGQSRMMQFVYALAGLALGLTLAVEYIVLDGDIGRQNTVFKFYIQVWLLFSVVGGAAFAWLASSLPRWGGVTRFVWTVVLGALVFLAALYPFLATPGKAVFRMAADMPVTLDGMDYMQYATQYEGSPSVIAEAGTAPFPLAGDYEIIRWLQENVEGSPVIMEGRSEREYLWGSRISVYTGLPSVVGWNWHQRQQRTFDPLPRVVEQRVANVNAFYITLDIPTAWNMLDYYDVEYIIVGGLERAYYPAENLAKFETMVDMGLLDVAFESGDSVIYHVNADAQLPSDTDVALALG